MRLGNWTKGGKTVVRSIKKRSASNTATCRTRCTTAPPLSLPTTQMLPTHRRNDSTRLFHSTTKFYLSRPSLSKYFLIFFIFLTSTLWYFWYFWYSPIPQQPTPFYQQQQTTLGHSSWSTRALHVKEAYKHAWSGYFSLASPADELLPISGGSINKYVVYRISFQFFCIIYPQFQWLGCEHHRRSGYHVDHGSSYRI